MDDQSKDDYIYNHVLVDCRDEYEQKSSWYHYLREELCFPFTAYMPVENLDQELNVKVLVRIEVVGLIDESMIDKYKDIMVRAIYNGYIMKFPLSEIQDMRGGEIISQGIELWNYWIEKREK